MGQMDGGDFKTIYGKLEFIFSTDYNFFKNNPPQMAMGAMTWLMDILTGGAKT